MGQLDDSANLDSGLGSGASQVALVVKNLPAVQEKQEMWIRSPGRKDPLEEGGATNSSILAWRIPWTGKPGRLQSMRSQSQTQLSDWGQLYTSIEMHTQKSRGKPKEILKITSSAVLQVLIPHLPSLSLDRLQMPLGSFRPLGREQIWELQGNQRQ